MKTFSFSLPSASTFFNTRERAEATKGRARRSQRYALGSAVSSVRLRLWCEEYLLCRQTRPKVERAFSATDKQGEQKAVERFFCA